MMHVSLWRGFAGRATPPPNAPCWGYISRIRQFKPRITSVYWCWSCTSHSLTLGLPGRTMCQRIRRLLLLWVLSNQLASRSTHQTYDAINRHDWPTDVSCFLLGNVTCGGVVRYNRTYFTSPLFPIPYLSEGRCAILVRRPAGVPQLKINFVAFELKGPSISECIDDFLQIPHAFNLPKICGRNIGQHRKSRLFPRVNSSMINIENFTYQQSLRR